MTDQPDIERELHLAPPPQKSRTIRAHKPRRVTLDPDLGEPMPDHIDKRLLSLLAHQDQDKSAMREWWASSSLESKKRVFMAIIAVYDDPAVEVMSRFAQVAFFDAVQQYGLSMQESDNEEDDE